MDTFDLPPCICLEKFSLGNVLRSRFLELWSSGIVCLIRHYQSTCANLALPVPLDGCAD